MHHVHIMNELSNFIRGLNYAAMGAGDLAEQVCDWFDTQGAALIPGCPLGHELVAVPIDHQDRPFTPSETVEQALAMLDFGLSFALCNMDHGGTRRDVKKAQKDLEDLKRLLKEEAMATGKTTAAVTKNENGIIVCVSEQNAEGQVLRVIAESDLSRIDELYEDLDRQKVIAGDSIAKNQSLHDALETARKDERIAMQYLQEVRDIIGGNDFPEMIEKIRELARSNALAPEPTPAGGDE